MSTATVSRVLNHSSRVAPETAERVQAAILSLGYRPNVFAQGLMTRKSHLLGLLLPDIHGEFYSELLRGADTEARASGYHVLVSSAGKDQDAPLFNSNMVGILAGLAVMITEPDAYLIREAGGLDLPLVVIDRDLTGPRTDRVLVDNRTGTRQAVEHLLGHVPRKDVFFLGGPESNFDTAERAAAFREALRSPSYEAESSQLLFESYTVDWGFRAAHWLLEQRVGRKTAILAGNDEIAVGVLQAAQELGLDVPGKVQIVGFDDTRVASMVRPQLSAVHVPMADVGAAAVRLLLERMGDPAAPGRTVTLSTSLVIRGTTLNA
ncbi:MAG: LacI family transcriptional regulator [Phycisphaerales bacterium]|nr:LacI family transcriptional regulator [Phycisphaerales bacterium]